MIDANSFETVAVMEASRLRKRSRNRRRARSISDSLFILSSHVGMVSALGQVAEVFPRTFFSIPDLRQDDDDTPVLVILCKIAHTARKYRPGIAGTGQSLSGNRL